MIYFLKIMGLIAAMGLPGTAVETIGRSLTKVSGIISILARFFGL